MTGQQYDTSKIEITPSVVKGPLGTIALFVALVEAMSAIVLIFPSEKITEPQLWCLVIFVIGFPILLLAVFYVLVTKHNNKLWGPEHFQSDEAYLMGQGLAMANKGDTNLPSGESDFEKLEEWLKDDTNFGKFLVWKSKNKYTQPNTILLFADPEMRRKAVADLIES